MSTTFAKGTIRRPDPDAPRPQQGILNPATYDVTVAGQIVDTVPVQDHDDSDDIVIVQEYSEAGGAGLATKFIAFKRGDMVDGTWIYATA